MMAINKSALIPVLILIIISSKFISAIYSETWSVTQFEELKIKHKWMINNFDLVNLQEPHSFLNSQGFWPPENQSFKWYLSLYPQSGKDRSYIGLYLQHNQSDIVHVNYKLSIGSQTDGTSGTFRGISGWGFPTFIKRQKALKSCLPNGTLIINCEIRAISKIVETSGTNLNQDTGMKKQTTRGKLAHDLSSLLENKKFSDITIVLGETKIQAHKAILAARSPVFESLFMENSTTIEINDVQPEIFRTLLQYIYTDELKNIDNANELLIAATKYNLEELKAECEEILRTQSHVNVQRLECHSSSCDG